jgi:hypothetical protein
LGPGKLKFSQGNLKGNIFILLELLNQILNVLNQKPNKKLSLNFPPEGEKTSVKVGP